MYEQEANHEAEDQHVIKQNQSDISSIKFKIHELEKQIDNTQMCRIVTDDSIASLLQEIEQMTADLKSQKRRNEALAEQLKREKEYYRKEKKQFHKEIRIANERRKNKTKSTKLKSTFTSTKLVSKEVKSLTELRQENVKLKEMLSSGAKITFNICMKFQRIKKHKDFIQARVLDLEDDLHYTITYLENLLKDSKHEINSASAQCFSGHIHKRDSLFLETNQRNHLLMVENLALKSECQELQTSLKEEGSRKKTKASESDDWLPQNSISYRKNDEFSHPMSPKMDDPYNAESFCDAAILDVTTAYVSRLTPSMLDKKNTNNSKIARRRVTQQSNNQRVSRGGPKTKITPIRPSPAVVLEPAKLFSRK